ncbi:MAG: hypothetical protein A3K19_06005 [Lentisphaerae bacterium RIFOXYB12_FULL_65_16]|nr:MAG: hypothetical protein A3K18_34605 [Lentisphaerae bacterium RIFOXYA12_64_32]OGV94026.1 MAG: hypothetical protein A3K19_06005 [Lentisphaerae bacterium RIFOXYB12_FULL_65_16]
MVMLASAVAGLGLWVNTATAQAPAKAAPAALKPASEEVKKEIQAILDTYKPILEMDFQVKVKSQEINNVFAAQMPKDSPMPIALDHFLLTFKGGQATVQLKFANMAPAMEEMIAAQMQANPNSPFSSAIAEMTYQFPGKAIELLLQKDFGVAKETPEVLDVEVRNLDEAYGGTQKLKAMRVRFDRKKHVVSMVRFGFEGKKGAMVALQYKPMIVPGHEGLVLLQSQASIDQTAFMAQGPQGQQQGFPQKMTVTYSDYKFDAVDEAKGEAKPEAKPDAKPAAKPDAPAAAEDKW